MQTSETVGEKINEFYVQNEFGADGGANEKLAWIKFGFISLPLPNLESRKNNVYLHDVNHIVTGFDTNWKGESAVSAWEVASGGWKNLLFPWLLTLWAMGLGLVFYRNSTLAAFEKGNFMKNTLNSGLSKNEINKLTINELRKKLTNNQKSNTNSLIWFSLAFLVFVAPFIIFLFGALFFVQLLK